MDGRKALEPGTVLSFSGTDYEILGEAGRGSNAIVYRGRYFDSLNESLSHYVLIKELFPLHPGGAIYRDAENRVICAPEGESLWELHRYSFETGNRAHLTLMETTPDQVGANLNTYRLNNTLYTVMGLSGGVSLEDLMPAGAKELRPQAVRMMSVLDALSAFHQNGLAHLDIAPDNILVIGKGTGERVLLIDYNSCSAVDENGRLKNAFSSMKDGYTAPEIRSGLPDIMGFEADLYSVTAVFFRMITGETLSPFQMICSQPPDVSRCACMKELPDTVCSWVKHILRRGLNTLPQKRYRTADEMKRDFQELLDRIDGVGVTHWALWEAGRRSVQRLVNQNQSLSYLKEEAELYPLRVALENGQTMTIDELMGTLPLSADSPVFIVGAGGIGKSTALLRTVLSAPAAYSPRKSAMIYLPLSGWKKGEQHYITDRILRELRFDAETRTMEDARHALFSLLDSPKQKGAHLILLLDGLNEAAGSWQELIGEINELSSLRSLRMVITSRSVPAQLAGKRTVLSPLTVPDVNEALARHGLLIPEKEEMRRLLQMPMMLSMFIQTAKAQERQVLCGTETELLDSYFQALCNKAGQEDETARYQAEMALYLVLPVIAGRMRKHGGAMSDQALMSAVVSCRAKLNSRILKKAFPQWIGHGSEMIGDQKTSDDDWYSLMVHQILWRKLGMLTRDESGYYHMPHQILHDYLLEKEKKNRRAVWKARFRNTAAAAAVLLLLAASYYAVYEFALKPKPPEYFDAECSRAVLSGITRPYAQCKAQRDAMQAFLDGDISGAECGRTIAKYTLEPSRAVLSALRDMESNPQCVVAGSENPFDFDHDLELLYLPAFQGKDYQVYLEAYEIICDGGTDYPLKDYCGALKRMLSLDEEITQLLCQLVGGPHLNVGGQEERWVDIRSGMDRKESGAWELLSVAQEGDMTKTLGFLSDQLEKAKKEREELSDEMTARFDYLNSAASRLGR